jgi:very-short-patch-repair endonuclease
MTYTRKLIPRAQEMRHDLTYAEQRLWFNFLQNATPRVRRQRPFEGYILDFYCAQLKLVIELDGSSHDSADARAYDAIRTELLEAAGLQVVRFTNAEVSQNLEGIIKTLETLGLRKP